MTEPTNGTKAKLDNHEDEIRSLRARVHQHATELTTLNMKVAILEKAVGTTGSTLDGWKNWAIAALAAGLLYMLLRNGLPVLKP